MKIAKFYKAENDIEFEQIKALEAAIKKYCPEYYDGLFEADDVLGGKLRTAPETEQAHGEMNLDSALRVRDILSEIETNNGIVDDIDVWSAIAILEKVAGI